MTRELMFKKMSLVSVVTSTLASLFGIAFAYNGFGVWALVLQQILANLFDVIALTIVFKWKYSLKVSINAVKEMLTFTIGVIGTSFLDFLGNNINSIVIGKAYRTTDLGYYNRGFIYPETIRRTDGICKTSADRCKRHGLCPCGSRRQREIERR